MTQPPPPPNGYGSGGWPPGYPGGQPGPQWNPQQGWPQTPPPKRGFTKWIIGAVALIAVIAVTAVVAVSCTKSGGGSGNPTASPTTSGAPSSDFASANDTGPVSVITEDPSCAPLMPILTTLAGVEDNGWAQRDPSLPASVWGPELRSQYQAVGKAMRDAADQMTPLIRLTTTRVLRQLYQQFIAFSRAYADSIPTYTPQDNELAHAAVDAGEVLSNICQAITFGAASARGPLVPQAAPPAALTPPDNGREPQKFVTENDAICESWRSEISSYYDNPSVIAWASIDPNIPATQWTSDQKAEVEAVTPVMTQMADAIEKLGRQSSNPTLQDIAVLSAQYQRAYILSIPTYSRSDANLYAVARLAQGFVLGACDAVKV